MATITRSDFANRLRERFGLTSADSYKLVDIIFEEIIKKTGRKNIDKLMLLACLINSKSPILWKIKFNIIPSFNNPKSFKVILSRNQDILI